MSDPSSNKDPTGSEPTEEMLYRASVDLEVAALRMIVLGLVGVTAADKGNIDKANGFVRRVEQTSKQALATYTHHNSVYKEEEFRDKTAKMISGLLDALSFGAEKAK